MHRQHPQTAYRKYAILIGAIFENCDKSHSILFSRSEGCDCGLQLFDAVGVLPLHAEVFAAHVAVGSQLAVDGLAQVEGADDGGRR